MHYGFMAQQSLLTTLEPTKFESIIFILLTKSGHRICLKSQFLQRIYTEKLEVPNEVTNHSMTVM